MPNNIIKTLQTELNQAREEITRKNEQIKFLQNHIVTLTQPFNEVVFTSDFNIDFN